MVYALYVQKKAQRVTHRLNIVHVAHSDEITEKMKVF